MPPEPEHSPAGKTVREEIASLLSDTAMAITEESYHHNFPHRPWKTVRRTLDKMIREKEVYRVTDTAQAGLPYYGLLTKGRERYGHPARDRSFWEADFEQSPAELIPIEPGPAPAVPPAGPEDDRPDEPDTGGPEQPVPDTIEALAAYIEGCNGPDEAPATVRIYDRLIEDRGTEAGNAMWEAALSAIAHEQAIAYSRAQLIESLGNAVWNTGQAAGHLDRLCAPAGWDVDYAEGTRGADIAAFLEDAGRQLRAALALARSV